jgi:hypothetical protein
VNQAPRLKVYTNILSKRLIGFEFQAGPSSLKKATATFKAVRNLEESRQVEDKVLEARQCLTSLMGKRIGWGSGSKFRPFYVQFNLLLTTTIQSLSLSDVFSLLSSSYSSSISGVVAFVLRFFFAFFFDTSTSAFLTTSRISFVLKTNFPLIATRFPFLRSLRTRNSCHGQSVTALDSCLRHTDQLGRQAEDSAYS